MSDGQSASGGLVPLAITCTSTKCDDGLHCFKQSRKMKAANRRGECRSCGARLVDWERIQRRDITDIDYAFASLKSEMIRHYYWHIDFDQKAINHALRKGRTRIHADAEKVIRKKVGPAEPFRDGTQTPRNGNVIHYAQHATASCCRKCIEYWHGIERGRELTDEEVSYLAGLAVRYIDERLPRLPATGQKVSPIRDGTRARQERERR